MASDALDMIEPGSELQVVLPVVSSANTTVELQLHKQPVEILDMIASHFNLVDIYAFGAARLTLSHVAQDRIPRLQMGAKRMATEFLKGPERSTKMNDAPMLVWKDMVLAVLRNPEIAQYVTVLQGLPECHGAALRTISRRTIKNSCSKLRRRRGGSIWKTTAINSYAER